MSDHPEISFKIQSAFRLIDQEKVTPWAFLLSDMPPVVDFVGRTIRYRGVAFEGTPQHMFWNGFIEPFLEAQIAEGFQIALDHAHKRGVDAASCLLVARNELYNGITSIYRRMQDIDRRLRGSGNPHSVSVRDVKHAILAMHKKVNEYYSYAEKSLIRVSEAAHSSLSNALELKQGMVKETKLNRKCFVLMPFEEKYREVYTEVYKVACANNGINCWRVDEVNRPGSITRDIIKGIIESEVIIADLTSRNPNVFYELGIAHSTGSKTIMTCQNSEVLPFDISAYRVIFYEQTINGAKDLLSKLDQAIKELLSNRFEANNPVQEIISPKSIKPQKIPLATVIDFNSLTKAVQRYLFNKKIIYTSDVYKIDFYDLKGTRGVAKIGISRLINELLKNNLYDNQEFLKSFLGRDEVNGV